MKRFLSILMLVALVVASLFGGAYTDVAAASPMMHATAAHFLVAPLIGGMIINQSNLADLFKIYNAAFRSGFGMAQPTWQVLATEVPSVSKENHYAWLGQFPQLREWIGDRAVKSLEAYDYVLKNRKFESTVQVPRDDIEDDTYGVYSPLMQQLGYAAMMHPDEMVWPLLAAGLASPCYDGQYFFDVDHPVNGQSVANVDKGGTNNYWYLIDASRPIKPVIFQKRRDYAFRALTNLDDESIFMTDQFKFGTDARVNAGYGFWQQAFASNQALDATHFDAAYAAMGNFKSDEGRPLGMKPTHLICGLSNRAAALATIEADRLANGASNTNYKTVTVIVSPYLA